VTQRTRLLALLEATDFASDARPMGALLRDRPLLVYGAGECSHWFFEICVKMHGLQPTRVLDRRFGAGDTFEGVPACSPDDYAPTPEERRDAVVVVCVGDRGRHAEIAATLRSLGLERIVALHDLYEVHNPFSEPSALGAEGFRYFADRRDDILAGLDCFEDEASREVYLAFVETHLRRVPVPIPSRPVREQYFPDDVPLGKGHARFVCAGSYDGDTVRRLYERVGKVEEVVCFEPESRVFPRLARYLASAAGVVADRVLALPCAAWRTEELRPFLRAGGLGSRLSDAGDTVVQCVSLDHTIAGLRPTFLAIDAEGAEPDILRGAERILTEHRPDLGVCVYHAPHHVWELPLQLRRLGLDYRMHLRNYTSFAIETVLYATAGGA
jgi:FkbM family methyltransferase